MKLEIHNPKILKRSFRSGCWRTVKIYERHPRHDPGLIHANGGIVELHFESGKELDRFIAGLREWRDWQELEL